MVETHATLNRHETHPTTPDWVNIDHRRGLAFAPGDIDRVARDTFDDMPDATFRIVSVHRLSRLGAVITQAVHGTSRKGLEAEWQHIALYTFEGDLVNRCEIFDEGDLDAALSRFEELQPQDRRLENAASRLYGRFHAYFAARDWDATTALMAPDISHDDRRRVVNGGLRLGRDVGIKDLQAVADLGLTNVSSTVIATRGERLILTRARASDRPETFVAEVLSVTETNADDRIAAFVTFDPDDVDAAFEELDSRYLAGEAAAHAHTWSVIAGTYAGFNKHEFPPMTTDSAIIDHRQLITSEVGLTAFLRSTWELMPDINIYIEAVHRLSDVGTVLSHAAFGTSQEGFYAEWRTILLLTVEGDLISRCEMFDEADLDAALARFEELHPQNRQTRRLENAASRAHDRYMEYFRSRDWTAIAEILTDDSVIDDRHDVVNVGFWDGRDAVIANLQALAEAAPIPLTVIATRGERLTLSRMCSPNRDLQYGEFSSDMLIIAEINTDERIVAQLLFDADDIDAAMAELDARYLAGEAAAHAHTWSVITHAYVAMNRHELPATVPGWANIDHRRGIAFEAGDATAYLRAFQDPQGSVYVETVHRLSDLGAVFSWVGRGTSQEGFEAEWRGINVVTVEGDLINRGEIFDEADLDAALARFEELHPQPPRLENAASRADDRFFSHTRATIGRRQLTYWPSTVWSMTVGGW